MCISMVFCIKASQGIDYLGLEKDIVERIFKYGYGSGKGLTSLKDEVAGLLRENLPDFTFFEVHDLGEPHCACDIDQDIRNKSKIGEESNFFKLVKELLNDERVKHFSVLFADNDYIEGHSIRRETGDFQAFFERLNKWHTWQVEGYEPNRNAYYIADYSPMLYSLTPSFGLTMV